MCCLLVQQLLILLVLCTKKADRNYHKWQYNYMLGSVDTTKWFHLYIVWFFYINIYINKVDMLPNVIQICHLTNMLSFFDLYTGVNQWFLLVLFWKRCHWWAGPEELFKGNKRGKAGFQYAHRVHPGMTSSLCKAKSKGLFPHFYLNL